MREIKTCIFDLDGVVCDTAKFHFYAWKKLADQLGILFTTQVNERMKGVSRMESLEILLSLSDQTYTEDKKRILAEEKNQYYVNYISQLDKTEIFPGVVELLEYCREQRIKTALGSVSRNAEMILKRLELEAYFDAVIDGTKILNTKPDPEVFLKGAKQTGADPFNCVVFEDAFTGITAAKSAGMLAVGIGNKEVLPHADFIIGGLGEISPEKLILHMKQF